MRETLHRPWVISLVTAVGSALLAGGVVLMLRRWRNDVLLRQGQPGYKDVAMPREPMIASAIVGSTLGLLGGQVGATVLLACSPAALLIALSAVSVFRQSRTRLP